MLNADVCSEFPLEEMLDFHRQRGKPDSFLMLGTTVKDGPESPCTFDGIAAGGLAVGSDSVQSRFICCLRLTIPGASLV